MKQQLAHHTITGCNIRPGDLMASGTISGQVRYYMIISKHVDIHNVIHTKRGAKTYVIDFDQKGFVHFPRNTPEGLDVLITDCNLLYNAKIVR